MGGRRYRRGGAYCGLCASPPSATPLWGTPLLVRRTNASPAANNGRPKWLFSLCYFSSSILFRPPHASSLPDNIVIVPMYCIIFIYKRLCTCIINIIIIINRVYDFSCFSSLPPQKKDVSLKTLIYCHYVLTMTTVTKFRVLLKESVFGHG